MSDYSEATPLGNLSFTSVVIKDGVTRIGNYAFMYCTGLTKIESLAETPPACGDDAFSGVDKNSCELYVPEKSIKAYNDAEVWQDFFNIAAGISGVAQESNVGVSASNGTITVTGAAAGTVVEVYNANGTQVYRGTGNTVNVPSAGMYIVRAAGKTFKVNTAR